MKRVAPTYLQLKEQFGSHLIPYQTLLESAEWRVKRNEIITRDGEKCGCCGERGTFAHYDGEKWTHVAMWSITVKKYGCGFDENGTFEEFEYDEEDCISSISDTPTVLQVHHRYYIKGRLPWNYKSIALQTLCTKCHRAVHDREVIPVYEMMGSTLIKINSQVCSRCNGAGYFPQYNKVNDGRCFKCDGARYTNLVL